MRPAVKCLCAAVLTLSLAGCLGFSRQTVSINACYDVSVDTSGDRAVCNIHGYTIHCDWKVMLVDISDNRLHFDGVLITLENDKVFVNGAETPADRARTLLVHRDGSWEVR